MLDATGLAVATTLTLFIIPTLYRVFMRGHGPEDFLHSHHLD